MIACGFSPNAARGAEAMLVVMRQDAKAEEIQGVVRAIEARGFKAHPIPGAQRTAIGITGNAGAVDRPVFESLPGVLEVIPVTHAYKLVSREVKPEDTIVRVGDVPVGGREFVIAAGPCAVESLEQTLTVARGVKAGGRACCGAAPSSRARARTPSRASARRGCDPRRRPRGDGAAGRDGGARRRERRRRGALRGRHPGGRPEHAELLAAQAVRQARKPVLLKRGLAATLEEFLMSAEYILAEGNYEVILCERGVRTFSDFSRNALDLAVVSAVKRLSHLPILVDPSHGTGRRDMVAPMAGARRRSARTA